MIKHSEIVIRKNSLICLFLCIALLSSFSILAQDQPEDHITPNSYNIRLEHSSKNILGIFTGTTMVPTQIGSDNHREIMFVPTYGLEYGRKVTPWLGFGIHNEFELQTYIISNDEGEELDRSYIYVGSLLAIIMPVKHLGIFFGPGYEFTSDHNFRVFKIGVEYAMYRGDGHGWYLAPELSVDWISTIYSTFSFGLVIGKGF